MIREPLLDRLGALESRSWTAPESKPKKTRTTGGLVFSGIFHAILGTAAVYGTLQAKEQLEKPKQEKVEFVEMKKKDEPPPPKEETP